MDWLVQRHIEYLQKKIQALLEKGLSIIIISAAPVDDWLPWTYFDENNSLVWELDYRCDYNIGLKRQMEAERSLVEGYRAEEKNVYLLDAWRLFEQYHGTDGMYMDIMHPGSTATDLIA